MTIIVGLVRDNEVYMGCDGAGTGHNYTQSKIVEPKVFSNGKTLTGMCGSFRLGQILQYSLKIPDRDPRNENDMNWLVNDYIDAVRNVLKTKGHIQDKDGEFTIPNGDYLLGYKGSIYVVEDNFQVLKIAEEYLTTGCGYAVATGSLHSMKNRSDWYHRNAVDIVVEALEAACYHNAGCAPPLNVFKLDVDGNVSKVY